MFLEISQNSQENTCARIITGFRKLHETQHSKNLDIKEVTDNKNSGKAPVSLLPHLSKVFERIIYKQINEYMENKLSKFITGFRKLHETQHSKNLDIKEVTDNKNSGKASNLTLAKVTQIQKKSCC